MIDDQRQVRPVAADPNGVTRAEEIRSRYAAIVESVGDAIIAKDMTGVISAWNAAAERMFGYTEQEAIGQPITTIIPADLHEDLCRLGEEGLPPEVGDLLDTFECDAALTRARALVTNGRFPTDPSGQRHPWPMV